MIKTTIYAQTSKEAARRKGKEIGLTGEALRLFTFFNGAKLEIEV